ncbi:ribosomal protein S18 acetylase RimI-like enzyme [Bacillus sp. SORGH_AS 510]|uniref:GNAT family N-acetyltransferase n=1 Tax=Bacillus sp. SORGH_AS_0510 TaxID=3041771 RepID=UPI00278186C5|nr:GNAT family N-acetyltransferase [Bacillus sp. SORGH_AS_0510]MDQ1146473.1 ribosomal protein S18 acetylase RimI-like enzyme [Bacillus sp. SORGH_AS_0510]
MIKVIDLQEIGLAKELLELQRASYLVEAKLINFFEIPPLKESLEELIECGETFLCYFEEKSLAGAISYSVDEDELTICRMVVHPDHFRKGIAQKLLSEVESRNSQISVYKVSTGKDNPPAKNLYLKNGFTFLSDIEVVPGLYISNFEKRKVEE